MGKTTCACAAALYLAASRPAGRILLVSTDPAHSIGDALAGQSVPNLASCEIDSRECLKRFTRRNARYLAAIASRGSFLEEGDVDELLDLSVPGLDEIAALLEIMDRVAEDRYDAIVVDTAPAGHTLRLLALPDVLQQWLDALDAMLAKHRYMVELYRGAYEPDDTDRFLEGTSREVGRLRSLLGDPRRCRFVPVLAAEPLSLSITVTLVAELDRLHIPAGEMVMNGLVRERSDCAVCTAEALRQGEVLMEAAAAFPSARLWGLPLLPQEPCGIRPLGTLWHRVVRLERGAPPACGGRRDGGSSAAEARTAVAGPGALPPATMKLLLFGGKGGVGKTTLACASALRLARERGDVLLFSIDPAHSLSACLERPVGPREVRPAPGLTAVELDARAEYGRFTGRYEDELAGLFRSEAGGVGIDLSFEREALERVMDLSPPGLDELLAMTGVVELMEQRPGTLFVLDTAPTGHLLRFLEMPELVEAWLKALFSLLLKYRSVVRLPRLSQAMVALSKRLKALRRLLQDPARAGLMAVTLPTELAYEETCDLLAASLKLGVRPLTLFVNRLTPEGSCPVCAPRRAGEEALLARFMEVRGPRQVTFVYRGGPVRGIEPLRRLGETLYRNEKG